MIMLHNRLARDVRSIDVKSVPAAIEQGSLGTLFFRHPAFVIP
jgi:hypothetical protein